MNAHTCTQSVDEMARDLNNTALRVVGIACAAIGAIGLMLPLVPGTPFLLVAAFCFSAID